MLRMMSRRGVWVSGLLALVLCLVGAWGVWRLTRPRGVRGLRVVKALGKIPEISPRPPHYAQGDPAWASVRLGETSETLASSGCTISCAAMALSQKGAVWTPGKLHRKLRAHKGLTKRGWLIWSAIARVTRGRYRAIAPKRPSRKVLHKVLSRQLPVLAKIYLHGTAQHWVLIIGRKGLDYLVLDPMDLTKTPGKLSSYGSDIHSIRWIEPVRRRLSSHR